MLSLAIYYKHTSQSHGGSRGITPGKYLKPQAHKITLRLHPNLHQHHQSSVYPFPDRALVILR